MDQDTQFSQRDQEANDIIENIPHKRRQLRSTVLLGIAVIGAIVIILNISYHFSPKKAAKTAATESEKAVQVPEELIDGEGQWHRVIDNKLQEQDQQRQDQSKILTELSEKFQSVLDQQSRLIESMQEKIEQQDQLLMTMQSETIKDDQHGHLRNFGITSLTGNPENNLPKDISIYIPASTFVTGILMSGISVSTGITAQSNPKPVLIRLTDDAVLPGEFRSNLKGCKIIGSCFGDLSSERITIRLETLVCVDKKSKQSVETKVAGFVTGSDGGEGIQGRVVEVDKKYMANALLGGTLGGLANTAKKGQEVVLNPFAMNPQTKKSFGENLQDNMLGAAGDTASRYAEYYIKKAESIAPVLQVPAGVEVDVIFTEGVYFGQLNTKEQIESQRDNNNSSIRGQDSK